MRRALGTLLLIALTLLIAGCSGSASSSTPVPKLPFGQVVTYSAPTAHLLYAVTWSGQGATDRGCHACVTLWRHEAGADSSWSRVHDFGKPRHPEYDDGAGPLPPLRSNGLVMSADGRHGLLSWDRRLLSTDDGGTTWTQVDLPDAGGAQVLMTPTSSYVLTTRCSGDDCGNVLWRAPTGSVDWAKVPLPPGFRYVDDLAAQSSTLLAVSSVDKRPVQRSTDGGQHWTGVPLLAHCEGQPVGVRVLVATCSRGDWADSWVSVWRNGRWRTVYDSGPGSAVSLGRVLPIYDREFLVSSGNRMIRVGANGTATRIRPGFSGSWDAAGFVDATTGYLLSSGRLHRSTDGGRTWTVVGR